MAKEYLGEEAIARLIELIQTEFSKYAKTEDLNAKINQIFDERIGDIPAAGGQEGVYELLDTITLTEETSEVVIDKYADGTPLNLKKAYAMFYLPPVEKSFWVSMHINYKYYISIGNSFGNASYSTIYDFEAAIDGGLLSLGYAYHTNSVGNGGTWNTVARKLTKNIYTLIFVSSDANKLPVGTKIEVYGVKA